MPELPEVESRRLFAEQTLVGHAITRVSTVQDRIVYTGVSPRRFSLALTGTRVVAARRKGKHLWLELSRRPWPCFHFGMGGRFHAYRKPEDRPRFWKVEIQTAGGTRVAMTNPRRLGRIRLLEDPPAEPPISLLGHDPLYDLPGARDLARVLVSRKAPIKAVLLDQGFLAGVGNWIADEVLYQARLDPRRPARDLDPEEIRRLRTCLRRIILKAVEVDADADRFPRSWLFHHRWNRNPAAHTSRGERIEFTTLGGRTTAWVPAVQE